MAERRRGLALLLDVEILNKRTRDLFVLLKLFLVLYFLFAVLASRLCWLGSLGFGGLRGVAASFFGRLLSVAHPLSLRSLVGAAGDVASLGSLHDLILPTLLYLLSLPLRSTLLSASHTF